MALKRASGVAVENFIQGNIICQLGSPKHLFSNNRTQFVIVHMQKRLDDYGVGHVTPIPYYPYSND